MKPTCAILLLAMAAGAAPAEARRPNIVWIFSDDHAFQAFGAYGSRFKGENLTPNLDRLAAEGMVFDRAYVGNSICGPSRATLLTGKHSHKNGKISNLGPFDHDQPQFQKILRENGYQTALVGKIHLPGAMQGFDYWEVLPGQGRYINPDFITENGKTVYEGHSTDVITDRALRWMEQDRDPARPFMLMVHYKAPHRTWIPADRFREAFKDRTFPEPETLFDNYEGRGIAAREQDLSIEKSMRLEHDLKVGQWPERTAWFEEAAPEGDDLVRWKYQAYMRDYLACIAGIDENVGRLLEDLQARGLDRDTIVMYSSDQGFYLGEHGWFDKRFMYEESFRTPLMARWPGKIPPGSRNADLVQNIDNAPTFLDLAGVPIPADMQGRSLVPLLMGKTPAGWRESLYYHYYEYPGTHSVRRHEGVATDRYKLVRFYGTGVPGGEEWELYDLRNDPQEMKSRYGDPEMAGVVARLKAELRKLREHYEVPPDDAFPQQGRPARPPAPPAAPPAAKGAPSPGAGDPVVYRADPASKTYVEKIQVARRPLAITARVDGGPQSEGVVLAIGGRNLGYALHVEKGVPKFCIRRGNELLETAADRPLPEGTAELKVELTDRSTTLFLDGRVAGSGKGALLERNPLEGLSIGYDFVRPPVERSCVGAWTDEHPFSGKIAAIEVRELGK